MSHLLTARLAIDVAHIVLDALSNGIIEEIRPDDPPRHELHVIQVLNGLADSISNAVSALENIDIYDVLVDADDDDPLSEMLNWIRTGIAEQMHEGCKDEHTPVTLGMLSHIIGTALEGMTEDEGIGPDDDWSDPEGDAEHDRIHQEMEQM